MRTRIWQAAILPALFAISAPAATLNSFGPAIALAGGTITVTFAGLGDIVEPIIVDGFIGSGYAFVPGRFHFEVKGDTFVEDWKLINMTETDVIVKAVFDLSGSHSVFDNGGPNSPFSDFGVAGAEYLTGTPIAGSFEWVPWPDPGNFGDAFLRETILFAGIGPTGGFTTWHDDTDVITPAPEPGTWIPCALALVGAAVRFRRRSARSHVAPAA